MYIIVYIYIFIRYPSEIKQSFISWTFANRFTFTYRGGPKNKTCQNTFINRLQPSTLGNKSAVIFQSVPLPITPIN